MQIDVMSLVASATMGALVTLAGTWLLRDREQRRKEAGLARRAVIMAASLEVMFMISEQQATNFDVRRLTDLSTFMNSPEFMEATALMDIGRAYGGLAVLEAENLQYERISARFVDLHARAILGHLVESEDEELKRIEVAMRDFAKRGRQTLQKDVRPQLLAASRRLTARAQSPWEDTY